MATIDPSIAMGYKPIQIDNPMNQLAAMSQIQNAQNQNALAQYQLSSAQRTDEATNLKNQIYARRYNPETGQVDTKGLYSDLAQNPVTAGLIPDLIAKETKLEHERKQNEHIVSQIKKLDFETGTKIFSEAQNELKQIDPRSPDAPAQFLAYRERLYANPALKDYFASTGITKKATDEQVRQAIKTPQGLSDLIIKAMTSTDQFQKILHDREQLKVSQGNLGVNQQQLKLAEAKALREQTMGVIPAGYRLNKDTNELEAIPGGPTTVALPPKEKQKREAIYPKATSAIKAFENTSDDLIKDLAELRDHPGLSSITGIAAGRLPGVTKEGRAAQALYDKIVARGGFQALTDLKAAGGTLGAVSNQEGTQLKDSYAAINRTQDAADVKKALDQALANTQRSKERVREEYDTTYEYRNTVPRSSAAPNQTKSGGVDTSNPLLK
jgi:hypothetical protein